MNNHYATSKGLHLNYSIITNMIEENARVLDLGCGNGYLLKLLKDTKKVKGNGIEIEKLFRYFSTILFPLARHGILPNLKQQFFCIPCDIFLD